MEKVLIIFIYVTLICFFCGHFGCSVLLITAQVHLLKSLVV